VGPRAGLVAVVERKNPCPFKESNSGNPSLIVVAILTELSPKQAKRNERVNDKKKGRDREKEEREGKG
jgi:hypothetical protein